MIEKDLYDLALKTSTETYLSKDCEVGSVGCALINENGNIYFGKNLDMSCSLGMCAERNTISTMLSNEVCKIKKLICVHKSGKIIAPCGACREFMKQLGDLTSDLEIIISVEPLQTLKLNDLIDRWWREELKK